MLTGISSESTTTAGNSSFIGVNAEEQSGDFGQASSVGLLATSTSKLVAELRALRSDSSSRGIEKLLQTESSDLLDRFNVFKGTSSASGTFRALGGSVQRREAAGRGESGSSGETTSARHSSCEVVEATERKDSDRDIGMRGLLGRLGLGRAIVGTRNASVALIGRRGLTGRCGLG